MAYNMEVKQSYRLDCLPTEIIRSIARFTPAESVITLTYVNHVLRNTCYDPLVFRSCVEYSAAQAKHAASDREALDDDFQEKRAHGAFDVEALAEVLGDSSQAWARFAVASSLALQWEQSYSGNSVQAHCSVTSISKEASSRFVPQMLVLGRKLLIQLLLQLVSLLMSIDSWLYIQVFQKALETLRNLNEVPDPRYNISVNLGNPHRPITRMASLKDGYNLLTNNLVDSATAFWFCVSAFSGK